MQRHQRAKEEKYDICENNSYTMEDHFPESFQRLDEFRERGETCDICLLASNKKIMAHKLVLASTSEYFEKLIYGAFSENGKNQLELKEVKYETLSAIVKYMYTGKIVISSENVCDIYEAADCYLMKLLKQMCLQFLEKNFDKDNCVKIWILANIYEHDELMNAACNFIFSNLELISNTDDFLSLSNEEVSNLFNLYPKLESYDSVINSILKWATTFDEDDREEFFISFLNGISDSTNISEDYLENVLSKNELIKKNTVCNTWLANIYKEKLKIINEKLKLEQTKLAAEMKFTRFLYDQPIIFMKSNGNEFYKYNRCGDAFNLYNKISDVKYPGADCITYKKWIYIVGDHCSSRFAFDDNHKSRYESSFHHDHGPNMSAAILNDSMYLFGGDPNFIEGSRIDLNTQQTTKFSLLHNRSGAGAAVCEGRIYICGGYHTNIVEFFDPRAGRPGWTSQHGYIPFKGTDSSLCSAVAVSYNVFCTTRGQYKMFDARNFRLNNSWIEIEPPVKGAYARCLVSSHGKMYALVGTTIYEHNHQLLRWQNVASFPELSNVYKAVSFE